MPRRIEVFDNSHIQGTNAVGAMIVAGAEGFVKNQYRKFNIKSVDLAPGDDYAMMREVLTRRFKRLVLDEAEAPASPAAEAVEQGLICGADIPHRGAAAAADRPARRQCAGLRRAARGRRVAERGSDGGGGDGGGDAGGQRPGGAEPASEEFPGRPDLVLIDGGLGQLGVAREVLETLGITDVALIGVAKGPDRDAGREHFHMPGGAKPMMLEPRDPVLYFVQRLRDEAHRFAIGTHRAKRSKAIGANPLDEIAGIGPARKRALLKHFGSAKAVSRASAEDLRAIAGISAQMAQTIYDFFHERRD